MKQICAFIVVFLMLMAAHTIFVTTIPLPLYEQLRDILLIILFTPLIGMYAYWLIRNVQLRVYALVITLVLLVVTSIHVLKLALGGIEHYVAFAYPSFTDTSAFFFHNITAVLFGILLSTSAYTLLKKHYERVYIHAVILLAGLAQAVIHATKLVAWFFIS